MSKKNRMPQQAVRRFWIAGAALFLCLLAGLRWGDDVWRLLQNEAALEAFLADLGWLGPLGLIFFNAIQIVVAPVPGYVVQIASGYLFGPVWGGVWATVGLLLGATLSMWLVRRLGRPIVERLIGTKRLARWEGVTRSDKLWVWLVLILTPTGDLPYFLAGLSQVKFRVILLLTLLIRAPTTFVAAAIGAGAIMLSWWQLALLLALLLGVLLLFMRYQDRIIDSVDGWTVKRIEQQEDTSHEYVNM